MKVAFTSRAKSDLRDIAFYIARSNPARAMSFVGQLRAKAKQIGENPLAFPLVERFKEQGVRRRVFGNYLIFYRVVGEVVTVIRVLHGARDFEWLL